MPRISFCTESDILLSAAAQLYMRAGEVTQEMLDSAMA
jgi:hypothetical protein